MCVRVVAGCAPCRVTQLTLGVTLQRSAAPPFPSGPRVPPGAPYQNTLGAAPQDPLTLKLRLDTNDALASSVRRRRYTLKVPAAHFYVEIVDRVPLPRSGGGERGCGAERRQWRMQRGGAPAAVEKIEQASSAKIFSGTARRRGQIRRGYLWSASVRSTDLFFPIIEGKTIFVSSTAKRQRGLSRGNSSPLTRFCLLLAVQKEAPAGQAYSLCLCKRLRDAEGDHKLAPAG